MAHPLANLEQSSSPAKRKFEEAIVDALMAGHTPADIARKATDDRKRRKSLRKKIWRALEESPTLKVAIAKRAQAQLAAGLNPATAKLVKRAARLGKAQDLKLLFEASGFHNPRVQHEHSGDVNINLNIPRPQLDESHDEVIEAEVVDD